MCVRGQVLHADRQLRLSGQALRAEWLPQVTPSYRGDAVAFTCSSRGSVQCLTACSVGGERTASPETTFQVGYVTIALVQLY